MGKFDIDRIMEPIRKLMSKTGTWPRESPNLKYNLIGGFVMTMLAVFTITTFMKVFDFEDLDTAAFGLCIGLSGFHTIVKISQLFYNKPELYDLLKKLKDPIFADQDDHMDIFLEEKIRLCKFWPRSLFVSCYVTITTAILVPIFNKERSFPVGFPIDIKNHDSLVYYSIYGFQAMSMLMMCWTVPCFDGLLFTFIAVAGGQLRVLREKIIRATDCLTDATDTSLEISKDSRDAVINETLKKCVEHHIAIERYITVIENTFRIGFLVQLLVSLIITCFLGFNFIVLPVKSAGFLRSLFMFGAIMTELVFFCVPANEIILQSEKILDACYMSEWTECGPSVRKTLFIIMERSKRPLSLTAGRFVILSLDTFIRVLKTAFSYFTVLMQLYRNSKQ